MRACMRECERVFVCVYVCACNPLLKGNSHQKISVANMIELLLKVFWCITHLYSKPRMVSKKAN